MSDAQAKAKLIRKAKSKVNSCIQAVDIHFPVGSAARKEMFATLRAAMEALKEAEAIDKAAAYAERMARRVNQPTA